MTVTRPLVERFWEKVRVAGGDECWNWTAGPATRYGMIYDGATMERAHRVSWALHYGAVPPGLSVLHHCDNQRCVRPDHLFLGTQTVNMLDAHAKGRLFVKPRAISCARGHDFTPRNTRIGSNGQRRCRECSNAARRARRASAA
jgi:hypothetical protein